jgi:hypothetical protein
MLLVSMPGGTLAGPPSPTAVEGSIAGMTSIAEAVDASENSCGSNEFGTSKNRADDADFVASPTVVENSTTGATSSVEPIDASDESCGSGSFGASKRSGDDADLDVSPTAMEGGSIAEAASTTEAVATSDEAGRIAHNEPASHSIASGFHCRARGADQVLRGSAVV